MSSNKNSTDLQNCNKCGLCMSVCPVYKTLKEEQAAPRARLRMIKALEDGDVSASPLLKELISKCLMCGSCSAICPSGVDHYGRFMAMRSKMTQELGDPLAIRSLIFILAKNHRIRLGAGMARLGQRLLPQALAENNRVGEIPLDQFPKLNTLPLTSDLPEIIPARGPKRGSLLYFTGCATQYIFGDTGRAAVKLLTHLGYEIIIPKGQTCCGIPMMFHGAREQALHNMETNVKALGRAFQKYQPLAIVTDCSTCGTGLRDEYPALIRDYGSPSKTGLSPNFDPSLALKMASKVRDILSIIREHKDELSFKGEAQRVTYHLPCHTKNSFDGQAVVTDLLNHLDCFDHCPTPDMASCCGGGGTFFYEYPKISQKMSAKKIANAQKTGAKTWLTDCPVCRINLSGHLSNHLSDHLSEYRPGDAPLEVEHPLVVMARMLKE